MCIYLCYYAVKLCRENCWLLFFRTRCIYIKILDLHSDDVRLNNISIYYIILASVSFYFMALYKYYVIISISIHRRRFCEGLRVRTLAKIVSRLEKYEKSNILCSTLAILLHRNSSKLLSPEAIFYLLVGL